MTKIISLFNNKGGVSKTTTTFHLGWKLAELGYKTLIVDTDPQCNLTGLCLNSDKETEPLPAKAGRFGELLKQPKRSVSQLFPFILLFPDFKVVRVTSLL